MEASHFPFSTAHNLHLVMLPFSTQTDKRHGRTQTFPSQRFWISATTHPGYQTTLTCSGHVLYENTHATTERANTCSAIQEHPDTPPPVHTCTCLSFWLVPAEAKLIHLQSVKQLEAHKLLTSWGENVSWQAPSSSFALYLAAARSPPPTCSTWQPEPHAFTPALTSAHVQICALMCARMRACSRTTATCSYGTITQPSKNKQK